MLELISNILIFLGCLIVLISALGLIRYADPYLKLHVVAKSGVLGSGLALLGVGIQLDNLHSLTEVVLLILFIAITNPMGSHTLARSKFVQQDR